MSLQADLSKRYGCLAGGANDIKSHPWFKGVDWNRVARREDTPPIRYPSIQFSTCLLACQHDKLPMRFHADYAFRSADAWDGMHASGEGCRRQI